MGLLTPKYPTPDTPGAINGPPKKESRAAREGKRQLGKVRSYADDALDVAVDAVERRGRERVNRLQKRRFRIEAWFDNDDD